jgi:integrase
MAHLIRPWVTQAVRLEGKVWKRCKRTDPDAQVRKVRARKWYGAGIPGYPPGKRVPLCANKEAARQMLAALVKRGERGEAGLDDRLAEAQRTPLEAHLRDFEAAQRAKGRPPSDRHLAEQLQRIRTVFHACAFSLPRDIDAGCVEGYLAGRRRLPKAEGGISAQTSNYYLQAVNWFCLWMVRRGRMASNPLRDAEKCNADLDRRHLRRDLRPEELAAVLQAAASSPRTVRGLTGPDRHMLYLAACATGFRAGELGSMTPESFDLGGAEPVARLPARVTKNKKPVAQPLPAAVVPALRAYLAGKPAGVRLWPTLGCGHAVEGLRADLEAAGVPYVVRGPNGPEYADFHALRHTFCTMLERSGVTPKVAQALARHSDIRMTLNRYTHADQASMARAVERLALPGPGAPGPNEAPTYDQLAAAVVVLRGVLAGLLLPGDSGLFAPLFALKLDPPGNSLTRPETETAGADRAQPRRKPA